MGNFIVSSKQQSKLREAISNEKRKMKALVQKCNKHLMFSGTTLSVDHVLSGECSWNSEKDNEGWSMSFHYVHSISM